MAALCRFIDKCRPELVAAAIAIPAYFVLFSGIAAWIGALAGVIVHVMYLRSQSSADAEQHRAQSAVDGVAAKATRRHAA